MRYSSRMIQLYKNPGETPLECLERYRAGHPELAGLPMTYAGRLDPMAEGVLIALAGEECKRRDEYAGMDKEYEVDILFGFETDTYDALGKIAGVSEPLFFPQEKAEAAIRASVGKFLQEYPPYSSKAVAGKPLFQHAREGGLGDLEIPKRQVEICSIDILKSYESSGIELLANITDAISRVKGDFRQEEIMTLWKAALDPRPEEKFRLIRLKVACGSGTYMRSLAHGIGKEIGVPAIAYHIKRTKVGK